MASHNFITSHSSSSLDSGDELDRSLAAFAGSTRNEMGGEKACSAFVCGQVKSSLRSHGCRVRRMPS